MNIRTVALTLVAAASLTLGAAAQAAPDSMTRTTPDTATTHNWTTDQIITATVHQAWLLSDKNEATFFEIIKELAEISAKNRDLTLPDSPEAGQKAGAYIKKQAKADHDQLLYAIVDKSVRMTGSKAAGTK